MTGSQFVIELATWRDLNAVRNIEKHCFPKDAWPLWDVVGVLTLPSVVRLKAVSKGLVIGFVAGDIRRHDRLAWVATIGVLPEFRRLGVGAALMAACEAQVGVPLIRLCVRASNQEAIRLYLRLGYQKSGLWSRYYPDGEDALVMEKNLV